MIARAVLVGNLTRDAELRHTQGGMAVLSFSVAVNSHEKKNGEWVDYASFFDCTMFGNRAESISQYLVRGKQVGVDGRLKQERWEKDGVKKYAVKVIVDDIQMLGGKGDGATSGGQRESGSGTSTGGGDFAAPQADFAVDDDIPF